MSDVQTTGQRLVGLSFNPSGDDKVTKVKQLFADIIDLVTEDAVFGEEKIQEQFTDLAVSQVIIAQMAAVKAITWEKKPKTETPKEEPINEPEPAVTEPTPPVAPEPTPAPVPEPTPQPVNEPTPPVAQPVPTQALINATPAVNTTVADSGTAQSTPVQLTIKYT